ncbi:MAG: hypothetical protein WBP41_08440 [Saprospiraceae bacterium]
MIKYFYSCFLLTIPILAWNLLLTNKLPTAFQPEIFRDHIPIYVMYGENIFRTLVFLLTFLMPLSFRSDIQKKCVFLYAAGTLIYFTSWIILIYYPHGEWSNSLVGFLSPSLTPLLWLTGIWLIGEEFFINLPFKRWIFLIVSICFLLFHNLHTFIVYTRLH